MNAYEADINSVFDIYGDIVSISAPEFLPLADYIVVLNNITNGNENIDYSVDLDMEIFIKNTVDLGEVFDTSNLGQYISKDEIGVLLSERLKEYIRVDSDNDDTETNFTTLITQFSDNFIKNYLEFDEEKGCFIAKLQKDSEKIFDAFNALYPMVLF